MTARARNRRLGAALLRALAERPQDRLPGIEGPNVRAILNMEAGRPLRGGNADLDEGGLFGIAPLQPDFSQGGW